MSLYNQTAWCLGEPDISNPYALANAMHVVISLRNKEIHQYLDMQNMTILGETLIKKGIVDLRDDETYSIGRKWRSALNKLGFLYPEIPLSTGIQQNDVGPVDMITPNGWRLIRADTVPAMQECFLRALVAHYLPSALEFTSGRTDVRLIRELLDRCRASRAHHEAPAWKREIERTISDRIMTLFQ